MKKFKVTMCFIQETEPNVFTMCADHKADLVMTIKVCRFIEDIAGKIILCGKIKWFKVEDE